MVITPSTASGPPPSKMEAIQWEQAAHPTQLFIIYFFLGQSGTSTPTTGTTKVM